MNIQENIEWLKKSVTAARHLRYFYEWKSKYAGQLAQFSNIHSGEDCFIIGNGPSINEMDLERLNDYYTFGLNKIFLIFKRVDLELSYLVSINPLVIEQSREEFLQMDIPVFVNYESAKKNSLKGPNIFPTFFNIIGSRFPEALQDGVREGFTVTYTAMQLAYHMGFKRVFLIGVDHNFVQKGKPNEAQELHEDDVNHFDPNYFKGQKWHLADLVESEISYAIAKTKFESEGRAIFNATKGGKLEVFDRIGYEEALSIAKKKRQ